MLAYCIITSPILILNFFVLEEFGLNSQVANGDLHQNDLVDGQSSLNTRSMV